MIINVVQLRSEPPAFMVEEQMEDSTHRLVVVDGAAGRQGLHCNACESGSCSHAKAVAEYDARPTSHADDPD